MVDVPATHELLGKHFTINGTTHIDSKTGVVDVEGNVELAKPLRKKKTEYS